jgi:RimJ/RimL family protein N-acetyltransferase
MKSNSISIAINYKMSDPNLSNDFKFSLKLIDSNIVSNYDFIKTFIQVRQQNQTNYFNRTVPTVANLSKYLAEGPISNPNHYMFTVSGIDNEIILCCGFKIHADKNFEIDNVIRLSTRYPGLMTVSLESLCKWMRSNFEINSIFLRVISNNLSAINLYRKIGFVITDSVSLKSVRNAEGEEMLIKCDESEISTNTRMIFMQQLS